MIFKLFDMIVAAIIALLGVNVPGPMIQPTASQSNATTVQPQPTGTKVTSTPATPTPIASVPKTIGGGPTRYVLQQRSPDHGGLCKKL